MNNITFDIVKKEITLDITKKEITFDIHAGPNVSITGSNDALKRDFQLGENLSQYRVIANSLLGDGKIVHADSSDQSYNNLAIGLTLQAGIVNESVKVLTEGYYIDGSWNWDITKPIYYTNTGSLTQTVPVIGFVQIVANPISATEIIFKIQQTIKLT